MKRIFSFPILVIYALCAAAIEPDDPHFKQTVFLSMLGVIWLEKTHRLLRRFKVVYGSLSRSPRTVTTLGIGIKSQPSRLAVLSSRRASNLKRLPVKRLSNGQIIFDNKIAIIINRVNGGSHDDSLATP